MIDFRTHLLARPHFEFLAQLSPLGGSDEEKLERVAQAAAIELPPGELEQHVERWKHELETYGVECAVTCASSPAEIPALTRAAGASSGALIPFAPLDPTATGAVVEATELFEQRGVRGLVFTPAVDHYRLDGEELVDVLDVVQAHAGVAVVQCGLVERELEERFALPRDHDLTLGNPLQLLPAADRFPEVTFAIPAFGAGMFAETLLVGSQCENVVVDTSPSVGWKEALPVALSTADVFERALGVFGPERILFATGSGTFPQGWHKETLTSQREALGACGLSKSERQLILGGNALRCLGMGEASRATREQPTRS